MEKKGFELAMSTLVILILSVLVLGVLIFGFSLGWNTFWIQLKGFIGGNDNVQQVLDSCERACMQSADYDYCLLLRTVVANEEQLKPSPTCKDLEKVYTLNCSRISCG